MELNSKVHLFPKYSGHSMIIQAILDELTEQTQSGNLPMLDGNMYRGVMRRLKVPQDRLDPLSRSRWYANIDCMLSFLDLAFAIHVPLFETMDDPRDINFDFHKGYFNEEACLCELTEECFDLEFILEILSTVQGDDLAIEFYSNLPVLNRSHGCTMH